MSALPRGWALATLTELAGANGLLSDGDWVESKDQDPKGSMRLIQLADIGDGSFLNKSARFMNEETVDKLNCTRLCPGDVLIARMPDPIGRACIYPGLDRPAVTAVDVFIWRRGQQGADASWLVYAINSPEIRRSIESQAGGTTRQRIAGGKLKELRLPTPPLAEQRRIVAKLDSLTARTARARSELDHIPRLVEKYKQAILAKALSGELTKEWRKQHPKAARWTDCALADITDADAPICYGVVQPGEIDVGGVPLVRVCDLSEHLAKWDALRTITGEIESAYARSRIIDGDVLISVVGTIGRVAVVAKAPRAANIARAVARIRPNQTKVLSWWLAYALSDREVQHSLLLETREVARKTLNIEQLKACRLKVPPIPEQNEVVRIIQTAFTWLDKVAAEHARASHLVPKLDQAILAKAFRGELVQQDPNDEPARVLLERIKQGQSAPNADKRKSRMGRKAAK